MGIRSQRNIVNSEGEEDSGIASDGNPETEVAQNSWHMTFQSTVRGYTSFRHKEMGSFFLQIFCHTMEQIGHLSPFSDVLTKTSSMVTRILPRQVPQYTTCIPEELHFCRSRRGPNDSHDTLVGNFVLPSLLFYFSFSRASVLLSLFP